MILLVVRWFSGKVTGYLGTEYRCIQLFRERLSEKVHATTPKGIVGGLEFTILQRNFKELHERPWTFTCEC